MKKGHLPSCSVSEDTKICQSCRWWHTVFSHFFLAKLQIIFLPELRTAFNLSVKKHDLGKMRITYISAKLHLLQWLNSEYILRLLNISENKFHLRSISNNGLCNYKLNKLFWILSTIFFSMKRISREGKNNLELCPVLCGHQLP